MLYRIKERHNSYALRRKDFLIVLGIYNVLICGLILISTGEIMAMFFVLPLCLILIGMSFIGYNNKIANTLLSFESRVGDVKLIFQEKEVKREILIPLDVLKIELKLDSLFKVHNPGLKMIFYCDGEKLFEFTNNGGWSKSQMKELAKHIKEITS